MKCNDKGQSVVEYSLVIGIVIAILVAFSPMVKRGTQAMVKVVVDEVGIQQNSEEQDDGSGNLIASNITTSQARQINKLEHTEDSVHIMETVYNEKTGTSTLSKTSLGVSPE